MRHGGRETGGSPRSPGCAAASRTRSFVYGIGLGFVKVVDAPDQPLLRIPPGAEVLNVQIADAEHRRGGGQLGQTSGHRCTQR